MVNALIADANIGTPVVTGIDVSGTTTAIPTENLRIIDPLDGVVMSVSRMNGCDINADTTSHCGFEQCCCGKSESDQYYTIRRDYHLLGVHSSLRHESVYRFTDDSV